MNERLLFQHMMLPKRWVAESFVLATREIYADHPVYRYDEEDKRTEVIINPTYADTDTPGKKPKILAQGGGYDFSLNDSFGRNLSHNLTDPQTGRQVGSQSVKRVRMNMMILIQAYAEEESSDMADELAMLLSTVAHSHYASKGIIIDGVSVTETNVLSPEERSFQTVLNLTVEFIVEINLSDRPDEVGVDIDFDYIGQRTNSPSVTVFPTKSISED